MLPLNIISNINYWHNSSYNDIQHIHNFVHILVFLNQNEERFHIRTIFMISKVIPFGHMYSGHVYKRQEYLHSLIDFFI